MSINRLLMEVIRGEWFIDPTNVHAYLPLLNNLFEGKPVYNKPKIEAVNFMMDESGRPAPEGESGPYAFISMSGMITRYGDWCSYGAEDYVDMLNEIQSNEEIKGTILYLDGPGGSADSVSPFIEFSQNKTKPIVALISSAASAHYWIAVQVADYIIAENEAVSRVGSVGVMASFMDFKEYYAEKKIKLHEVYAPESEHKNQAFNLALEGKYDMIKEEMLSPMAKAFQNAVRAGRPNLVEATGVLSGKMFFASEAKKLGMIDAIGGRKEAINMINILSELNY